MADRAPGEAVVPATEAASSGDGDNIISTAPPTGDPSVTAPPSSTPPSSRANDTQGTEINTTASVTATANEQSTSETKPPPALEASDDASRSMRDSSDATPDAKSSAAAAAVDNLDGTAGEGNTYGTRSRNRAGNARINYAEDQDMDFELTTANATTKKKQPAVDANASNQSSGEGKRAQEFARFISANSNVATKESTPTSTGPATTTKKRKAGNSQGTAAASHAPATTASTRKSAAASASSVTARETSLMTFTKHKSRLNAKGELVADDGTKLCVNDHVYLVCEPPGDPYYLCRIMEFLHTRSDDPTSPIDALRVNWYYRPRDVQRFNSDSRLVYGTMHSDICPTTSLRGKCTILHRSEIPDLDAYRKERDSFYFVQVFDRFIRRWYECIPVAQIINVPERVKKALDERWKFVVVETSRVKELTSAVKTCKRCVKYCASHDSVDCAICKNSYHMNCVQPPLPKKPSRGFAWACAPCSRASERKLEQKNTPNVSGNVTEAEEEEIVEEELPSASNGSTRAPSPTLSDMDVDEHVPTDAEIALAKMWPMRYLGIHARVEDARQYDDPAIYPRASSRLGPRHQAIVNLWYGHPVELVKPSEIKKRYNKTGGLKKDSKMTKETLAALEADREERAKRPKWVQDEPPGYVARGEDYPNNDPRNTARLLFKPSTEDEKSERASGDHIVRTDAELDDFVKKAKAYARGIGVPPFGANFLDKSLELLTKHHYDSDAALKRLSKMDRVRDLHEPVLSRAELLKFEEGVATYGSEHFLVHRHMKTDLPISTIIRFYYLWKKTPKGQNIWGNFGGRKGSKRKVENDAGAQLQASVAHDADDSAYDNDKAVKKSRGFICKFCNVTHARQWRRAPFVSAGQTVSSDGKDGKEKGQELMLALCLRCAGLWRKYAIQWEDIDEVTKKVAQGGGKAYKRRIDEELLREIIAANEANASEPTTAVASSADGNEPPKKKAKTDASATDAPKKKEKPPPPPPKEPTPPPPPIVPTQPLWKALPCAVCKDVEGTLECAHCKLTVHRHCFGLPENEGIQANGSVRWVCEQCQNDRVPTVSTDYACCLCLTEETQVDLVEMPRGVHKKKTDRDREKERMEKELADVMRDEYRTKQLTHHRPLLPREPLKRTTGNNWVHVYCAVWTPEIRFSNAPALEVAEGFQLIPPARHEAVCKLCKNKDHQNRVRDDKGSCVSCFQCHTNFHVSCAFEAGYLFGFDVTPVKSSRKDLVTTATLAGETGSLTAGIWCKEHVIKTTVHPINEIADPETEKTALQVFVENYKQADLTLTGTVRKANLAQLTKDKGQQSAAAAAASNVRRESTAVNGIAAAVRRGARNSVVDAKPETDYNASRLSDPPEARHCAKCDIDVTPRWHLVTDFTPKAPTPPRSPHRRVSMTVSELADRQQDRSNSMDNGSHGNQNNIRFMPPGSNGRAWDGMPERFGQRPLPNGGSHVNEHPLASTVQLSRDGGPWDHHDPHRGHPSSHYPPPAANNAPRVQQSYLCHRCFIKRKIDPSPPPEDRRSRSPRHGRLPTVEWSGSKPPQSSFDPNKPIRMPHDEPPRLPEPPLHPPMAMGMQYNPPPPPPPPGYPHYGSAPPPLPGYHGPPPPSHPSQHPGPPPPPIHERRGSFGYSGPHPPPNPVFAAYGPPPHQPPPPQGPPPMGSTFHGYPPPPSHPSSHPPLANGIVSPPPQNYGSPSHAAPSAYPTFPPRRPEEHMSAQRPPPPPLGVSLHQPSPYHQSSPPAPPHHPHGHHPYSHQPPPPPHHQPPHHSPHLPPPQTHNGMPGSAPHRQHSLLNDLGDSSRPQSRGPYPPTSAPVTSEGLSAPVPASSAAPPPSAARTSPSLNNLLS